MDKQLKKIYVSLLLPSAAGFVLIYGAKMLGFFDLPIFRLPALVSPVIFILSVTFAVALPTFYRSYFSHQQRHRSSISEGDLARMEGNSIVMVMVAPYLALLAYFLDLPCFHLCGTILMGLYAVYYFYPSKRRLAFQKRLYRVVN